MNDSELVEGLRRQDPAAVRHLSECLLPSVWRHVYVRVKGDRSLAEDLVGESVLALIKAIAKNETEVHSPIAWLRTVAEHKLQDHFRAAARVQHLIDQADSHSSRESSPGPLDHQVAEERRAAVRQVMDNLPEQHRLALEWKYIDHLSAREIAGRMSISEKSVESILFRARREFRDGLGKLQPEDVPFLLKRNGKQDGDGRSSRSGRNGVGAPSEVEVRQPAGVDELKQRPSP